MSEDARMTLEQVVQEELEQARARGGSVHRDVIFRRVLSRLQLAVTSPEADTIAGLLKDVKD